MISDTMEADIDLRLRWHRFDQECKRIVENRLPPFDCQEVARMVLPDSLELREIVQRDPCSFGNSRVSDWIVQILDSGRVRDSVRIPILHARSVPHPWIKRGKKAFWSLGRLGSQDIGEWLGGKLPQIASDGSDRASANDALARSLGSTTVALERASIPVAIVLDSTRHRFLDVHRR